MSLYSFRGAVEQNLNPHSVSSHRKFFHLKQSVSYFFANIQKIGTPAAAVKVMAFAGK
jgi:hypothetical protein|tara:strand:- start:593 stop:766 length:174 start_codon:yes stop_codon:yes gene_type:complete